MFFSRLIHSIIIILISCLSLKVIQFALKSIFKITKFDERYENTLCSVLCSVSYYIMFILSVILILREFDIVDATAFGSLVTGASIVGIVAGVASQSILKDIFNGFFILFEKQIQVGDFVVINEEFRGVIEEIGIRRTSLRVWDLKRITIPNGNINSIFGWLVYGHRIFGNGNSRERAQRAGRSARRLGRKRQGRRVMAARGRTRQVPRERTVDKLRKGNEDIPRKVQEHKLDRH